MRNYTGESQNLRKRRVASTRLRTSKARTATLNGSRAPLGIKKLDGYKS